MSKFNRFTSTVQTTQTHQGGEGIKLSPKSQLVKLAITAMMEDTYYEKSEDLVKRMINCVEQIKDPDFVLKLAIYGRDKGLRSVNHVLAALYMIQNSGADNLSTKVYNAFNGVDGYKKGVLWRPDEMGEVLGAMFHITGKSSSVPNVLKRVYSKLISNGKRDSYQLSKYKNKGHYKLHDIVNLVRPKGEAADMIAQGNYDDIDTFEKVSSASGSDKAERKAKVQTMLDKSDTKGSKKGELGDKAFLMNIGNMLEDGIEESQLIKQISTRRFKGIFPYEFIRVCWFAHQRGMSAELIEALFSKAVSAFGELPIEGKTAVLVDTSYSMTGMMSDKSTMQYMDVGAFYGAIAQRLGGELWAWADFPVKIDLFPGDSPLRAIDGCKRANNGSGTRLQTALDGVKNDYDNVIVFSDMQIADAITNTGSLKRVYCFDLTGYRTGMSVRKNILSFAGFDDSMFKYGEDLVDPKSIVKEIEAINLI